MKKLTKNLNLIKLWLKVKVILCQSKNVSSIAVKSFKKLIKNDFFKHKELDDLMGVDDEETLVIS